MKAVLAFRFFSLFLVSKASESEGFSPRTLPFNTYHTDSFVRSVEESHSDQENDSTSISDRFADSSDAEGTKACALYPSIN